MKWAQAANDTAMQGYVLLKKSQMVYEERDGQRVATLAEAAQHGPWQLPANVRVEVTQQEARGLAMLGEPLATCAEQADLRTGQMHAVDGADGHSGVFDCHDSPATRDGISILSCRGGLASIASDLDGRAGAAGRSERVES